MTHLPWSDLAAELAAAVLPSLVDRSTTAAKCLSRLAFELDRVGEAPAGWADRELESARTNSHRIGWWLAVVTTALAKSGSANPSEAPAIESMLGERRDAQALAGLYELFGPLVGKREAPIRGQCQDLEHWNIAPSVGEGWELPWFTAALLWIGLRAEVGATAFQLELHTGTHSTGRELRWRRHAEPEPARVAADRAALAAARAVLPDDVDVQLNSAGTECAAVFPAAWFLPDK